MFIDNLSASIHDIFNTKKLTYESAAELCSISSRYLSNIMRKRSAPSIITLEKLCLGFQKTPNELLGIPVREDSYRLPMRVHAIRCYQDINGIVAYPICPRCNQTMEREYQAYCDRCGQFLCWDGYDNVIDVFYL